jgi:uncharacterized protein
VIYRLAIDIIKNELSRHRKVIVMYGARQTGKTTLLKSLKESKKTLWVNGDLQRNQDVLSRKDLTIIRELIDDNELLIIDEAQNIQDIGSVLKIIYDEIPEVQVIATGSSSLELASVTMEPLTGRSKTIHLYPVSIQELRQTMSVFDIKSELPLYLKYGMYPEILTLSGAKSKQAQLQELVTAYLYKDILQLSNIRHSDKIHKLLQLLAYQIGSLVSVNEISNTLGLNHETVNHYLDLLEKGFVIKRLSGLSNNPRKEISKMDKFYFIDVGVRNAIISNFSDIELRNDKGALWENFIFMERQKFLSYNNISCNSYFWRRYSGAEIDLIEQRDGLYHAFEIKWNAKKHKVPDSWVNTYPNHTFSVINSENFMEFVVKS